MTETIESPAALTVEIEALLTERAAAIKEHEQRLHTLDGRVADLRERRAAQAGGLDLAMINLAESVLQVRYIQNRNRGEGRTAISAAISDLAAGAPVLRRQQFATKSYDRWDGQRCDCEYGYGPRHGSIIFSIGLVDTKCELTPEQTDAAIAYLVAIDQVAAAKAARGA